MLRFDQWMDGELYAPGRGFYERGGGAGGRGGDFITSPEVGPLFGAVLADVIARSNTRCVVEVGASRGTLAASILHAGLPDGCRYVCVERSATLRAAAAELLGDRAEVRATPPDGPIDGVVIANELLDNLPFRIVERTPDGWSEVWVDDTGDHPGEVLLPIDDTHVPHTIRTHAEAADPGTRFPVLDAAYDWVDDVIGRLGSGRLLMFDYGVRTTNELIDRQWLRTYSGHQRGHDPFELPPGGADITVDIAVDQLPAGATVTTQSEFLRNAGIDALVDEGRRIWTERAHIGDLAALRARSRVNEADALLDPSGLGAFLAISYGAPIDVELATSPELA